MKQKTTNLMKKGDCKSWIKYAKTTILFTFLRCNFSTNNKQLLLLYPCFWYICQVLNNMLRSSTISLKKRKMKMQTKKHHLTKQKRSRICGTSINTEFSFVTLGEEKYICNSHAIDVVYQEFYYIHHAVSAHTMHFTKRYVVRWHKFHRFFFSSLSSACWHELFNDFDSYVPPSNPIADTAHNLIQFSSYFYYLFAIFNEN